LSVSNFVQKLPTDLHDIFKEGQTDDRQTTDGRVIAYGEGEREFTFAKNGPK